MKKTGFSLLCHRSSFVTNTTYYVVIFLYVNILCEKDKNSLIFPYSLSNVNHSRSTTFKIQKQGPANVDFEKDIFISYAHIDDQTLKEGEKGWVAGFHRALELRLAQLLGERPRIWRDQKLQGNDVFGDEIVDQFPKTALLVSILSPRYTKSEWCTKEVNEFYEVAKKGIGTTIANKSRIFKVIKTPIGLDTQPEQMKDTLGYEFYRVDPETGRPRELSQRYGDELEEAYWARLDDLAHDISDLLEKVKETGEGEQEISHSDSSSEPEQPVTSPSPPKNEKEQPPVTVYLAESSYDIREQRDSIKRELQEFGYKVVPQEPLSPVEDEYKKAVNDLLVQSDVAVHMVGNSYGMIPEGAGSSVIALQNELAAVKSKERRLPRIIWLPPDIAAKDERQQTFVKQVQTDSTAQEGAELFQTSVEDLKDAIHEQIEQLGQPEKPLLSTIYLGATTYPMRTLREDLKKQLQEQGYKVLPEGQLPMVVDELEKQVEQALEQSDIALLLVDENYSMVPEGGETCMIDMQYQQLIGHNGFDKARALAWIASGAASAAKDERQAALIGKLKSEGKLSLIESAPEAMHERVQGKLRTVQEEEKNKKHQPKNKEQKQTEAVPEQKPEQAVAKEVQPRVIYLICEKEDLGQLRVLETYFSDQGHQIVFPSFEGDEKQIREDHEANLKRCDAVLIYYGAGSDLWTRSKCRDLLENCRAGPKYRLAGKRGVPGVSRNTT